MAKCDLGKTIIDELRICYTADPTLIQDLSNVDFGKWIYFCDFALLRVVSKQFKYGFEVFLSDECGNREKVATLRFGHHNEQEQSTYMFFRIENYVLYNKEKLHLTLTLPDTLGMLFKHFTSIDLSRDFKFNVCQRIRKIARDKKIKVIINGKVIDKRKDIKEGRIEYSLNFTKLSNPTIYVKQAKAVKDKSKGLSLCSYNKNREIETSSNKDYIKEFYGNPKTLHRLEVHQNNDEIRDYCKSKNITQNINLMFNQEFLNDMYDTHLSSLLRFTSGRTKLNWHEILQ